MKLDKIIKKLDKDTVDVLSGLDSASLYGTIVRAEQSMKEVTDELEANPKYQTLKEDLKALTAGKREVNTRQRAVISYCLHLLTGGQ